MSFDLVVWIRPIPTSAVDAEHMLGQFYEGVAVFEADGKLEVFRAAVLDLYPPLEDLGEDGESPWAMTPAASDRLVEFNVSWQADDRALLSIVDLAQRHGVVLYDPQGPDVHSPRGIPRESGATAGSSRQPRPWLPILTVGGVLLLCFTIVLIGWIASQATK